MEIVEDDHCFVCGRLNPGGLHARFQRFPGEGRASCRLVIPVAFQGWKNVVHGGVIGALLDEAAIYACRTVGDHFVTAELQVRFKLPVPVGTEVTVTGEIIENRRRVLLVRSRLEIDDTLYAEAEAKVVRVLSKIVLNGDQAP